MEETHGTFTYTYSAKEQEEIKKIRSKYAPPTEEESTLEKLRRLDASSTRGATIVSLIVGIVGTLILGIGMCCTLIPSWSRFFILGIIVGIVGLALVISAYPIYSYLVKRKRKKLAPQILSLCDELQK